MAARKKAPAKKAAPKKSSSNVATAPLSPKAQEAKWKREADLRALQEAEQVRSDPARLRGAQREAKVQQRALEKIVQKK